MSNAKAAREAAERIARKRAAYRALFLLNGKLSPAGDEVMRDLRRFCRYERGGLVVSPASKTVDPYATIYQNGLRDAYVRIAMMIGLEHTDNEVPSDDGPAAADQRNDAADAD